ncbi:hypothetical protein DC522_01220 [Microvirga sp. KLBC 81]|uniref:phasin family protein n=1 Tax=Microvirga sp. KLBC 81 TaxID=1862707 RepID=UPI000D5173F3|nr:phasin family protein [Microvirga sp. KLBC 81]PVE26412.1 hypothetical protein DC522_01220 [Microvirga sp. KLBC 81]
MTETKKTRTRSAKSAPKADLVEMAAAPAAEATAIVQVAKSAPAPKPSVSAKAKPQESEPFVFSLRDQSEALRQAVREAVSVSAKGALEVNDKIIQALQTQGHAALDLWRTAIDNSHQPGGFNAQTGAAREAFETASAQWKDIAETTAHWMTKSVEPLQSALMRHQR